MADRLINENAVLRAIDARLEAQERLITNKYARAADRHLLVATMAILRRAREDVEALPSEDYTENDKARMFEELAANDICREECAKAARERAS